MDPELKDTLKISLIQKDISYIQKDVSDIKTILKEGYVTKDSLVEVAKEAERRLVRLESQSNLWKILNPTLAATLGSILTFLLVAYITKTPMS